MIEYIKFWIAKEFALLLVFLAVFVAAILFVIWREWWRSLRAARRRR